MSDNEMPMVDYCLNCGKSLRVGDVVVVDKRDDGTSNIILCAECYDNLIYVADGVNLELQRVREVTR